MKNFARILSLMLALVMCLCSVAVAEEAPLSYAKGDKIQDFAFTTYDGQELTLYEVLQEKEAVLINIWATWCGPCRNEFPYLQEAYEQYKDKVEVIALSCEETDDAETLAAFAEQYGLTFKIGQDPVGFLSAFGIGSIPTSFVVDRFGTICFVETGSQPDVGSFTRLFDAFLGDDYTESVLLDAVPAMKPTVAASSEDELAAALEAAAVNPADQYTWPMVVTEKDGRSVVASTNATYGSTEAAVTVNVDAMAGDAIVVTFKTSTETGCDLMNIAVNGSVVKVFGGEHDWMTYAVPVEADGAYAVTLSYVKDMMADGGEDTIWVDAVTVVSGDEAAAAIAANPAYPVADTCSLTVTNPEAKEVVISDDNGLLYASFGPATYYIVNGDEVSFAATLSAEYDPEGAFFYGNYDGSTTSVLDGMTADGYTVSNGVDSIEVTGYTYAAMFLYCDGEGSNVETVIYFKDEPNLNQFVTANALGTWTYADGTTPSTNALPGEAAEADGMATYTLKCVDQDGNPVVGAMMQVCNEETCQVYTTDDAGVYAFTAAAYAWEIHVLKAPEGYTADSTEVVLAPVEGGELVFTFTKN